VRWGDEDRGNVPPEGDGLAWGDFEVGSSCLWWLGDGDATCRSALGDESKGGSG